MIGGNKDDSLLQSFWKTSMFGAWIFVRANFVGTESIHVKTKGDEIHAAAVKGNGMVNCDETHFQGKTAGCFEHVYFAASQYMLFLLIRTRSRSAFLDAIRGCKPSPRLELLMRLPRGSFILVTYEEQKER